MAKTKVRNGARPTSGALPHMAEAPVRTVSEVLAGVPEAGFRAAARKLWRRVTVLGRVVKECSVEEIGEYLVIPRSGDKPELRRDDVLVRLLDQRSRHREMDIYTFAELTRTLPDSCKRVFQAELVDRFASNRWPAGVATARRGKSQRALMLIKNLAGVSAAPTGPTLVTSPTPVNGEAFASAFEQAFDRLRRERPFNMVELLALRNALPGYSREQFDRGLHGLRRSGEFLLETFEGRHGSLSSEELAASIREDGRVFAYAARRDRG